MSSGLLYLAIVGVWALVLVPMWLRGHEAGDRGHAERSRMRLLSRRPAANGHPPTRPRPPDGGVPGAGSQPLEYVAAATGSVAATGDSGAGDYADNYSAAARVRPPPGDAAPHGTQPDHTPPAAAPPIARPAAASHGAPSPPAHAPWSSGRRRARVIARRRRRLFGTALLFLGAVALAASRLAPWWVIGPPAMLLLGYLALLRAARQVDLERARMYAGRWAPEPSEHAFEGPAQPDADAAPSVGLPAGRGADVIPLSVAGQGRDEPYDQYADAGLRAVGD